VGDHDGGDPLPKASIEVNDTPTHAAGPYRRRLERLARKLLERRFKGAADIWKLELDLLDLQQDIQAALSEAKRRHDTARETLERLRDVLRDSRRFGDTLAWVLLRAQRRYIYPLAANERTPVPPRHLGGGGRATLAGAQVLADQGFGFPILHDITDVLRVGDLTFVKADEAPVTFEIKSRILNRRPASRGRTQIQYSVSAYRIDGLSVERFLADGGRGRALGASAEANGTQLARQMDRMTRAYIHSTAPEGVPYQVDGQKSLSVSAEVPGASLASVMNRAVRGARREGIGYAAADRAFVYVAFYDATNEATGETAKSLLARLDGVAMVAPILSGWSRRNGLVVDSIPPRAGRGPELHLPYFLLPIPRTARLDMAGGRLVIMVMWNPGRVAERLEEAGFTVRFESRGALQPEMVAAWSDTDGAGQSVRGELHHLDLHLREMLEELRPVEYLVEIARAMRAAGTAAFWAEAAGAESGPSQSDEGAKLGEV